MQDSGLSPNFPSGQPVFLLYIPMNHLPRFALLLFVLAFAPLSRAGAQMKVSYDNAPQPAKAVPALNMEDVDQLPEFKGDLSAYLAQHLQYPDSAREAGVQGSTIVEFVVSVGGNLQNVRISRSSGFPLLDNEALRLFREMQSVSQWTPGSRNGRAVPVIYTLPVTFKL